MFRLSLFGGFQLIDVSGQPIKLISKKVASLLAHLAMNPDMNHRQEDLISKFWGNPDQSEDELEKAKSSLRTAINDLRKKAIEPGEIALGTHLNVKQKFVCLNSSCGYWLDVLEFEAEIAKAKRASGKLKIQALEQARTLYGGELLPEIYDDWCREDRAALDVQFVALLNELTELYMADGHLDLAIECARESLSKSQIQEDIHCQLMTLYAANGKRSDALQQYETCKDVLKKEWDVEPSAQTKTLFEDIKSGIFIANKLSPKPKMTRAEVSIPGQENHNLPQLLTHFVGRENEINSIKHLFSQSRLVTLTGAGGSGKTRLAIQVGIEFQQSDEFSDGIKLIELSELKDETLLIQEVAKVFGLTEGQNEPLIDTLKNELKHKKLLLILDNCEKLIAACAELVNQLLTDCVNLSVLATSLEKLGNQGEIAFAVPVLSLPLEGHSSNIENLLTYEAVKLFVDRASNIRPHYVLTEKNADAVVRICRRLEGIPLSIELAASRLNILSEEQIEQRLDHRFQLLSTRSPDVPTRHQTMLELLKWSYELLTEKQKRLLNRLSVFSGGFNLRSVEAVCQGEGIQEGDILDLLSQLVDKSTVFVDLVDGASVRYRMLETVRGFAVERLQEEELAPIYSQHHLQYFLQLARESEPQLSGSEQKEWLNRLAREHDNFRAAINWTLENKQIPEGLKLSGTFWPFWNIRSHFTEGLLWLEKLIERSEGLENSVDFAKVCHGAAMLSQNQGDYLKAEKLFKSSLELYETLNSKEGQANVLKDLGTNQVRLNRIDKAQDHWNNALSLFQDIEDRKGEAYIFANLGVLYYLKNQHKNALDSNEQCSKILDEIGDQLGAAKNYNNLGSFFLELGDAQSSFKFHKKALSMFEGLKDEAHRASALINLSAACEALGVGGYPSVTWGSIVDEGKLNEAFEFSQEALNILKELKSPANEIDIMFNLGSVCLALRNYQEALGYFQQGFMISENLDFVMKNLLFLSAIGCTYFHLEQFSMALKFSDRAVKSLETLLDETQVPNTEGIYFAHSQILSHLGETQKAGLYLGFAYESIIDNAEKIENEDLKSIFLKSRHSLIKMWKQQSKKV